MVNISPEMERRQTEALERIAIALEIIAEELAAREDAA